MQLNVKKLLKYSSIAFGIILLSGIAIYRSMDLNLDAMTAPGVTFSAPYAEELGLDPMEALTASLDDLGVRHFRIPAYWSLVQPSKSTWNWTWLDQELDAIAERGGTVTLAIGHKLPRWPECWTPTWVRFYSQSQVEDAVKIYLDQTVARYKDHPAVIAWQVENEPNFPFGICPDIRDDFIGEEIEYVRSLDSSKPIATTDSGELTLWSLGKHVDLLGASVYRVVKSPIGIFRYWFIPPQFYLRKGELVQKIYGTDQIYISEFQMEPWVNETIPNSTLEEQYETFDVDQMRSNIDYAKHMGIERIDFWGIEWWYWMKTVQNNPEYWEEARNIFN